MCCSDPLNPQAIIRRSVISGSGAKETLEHLDFMSQTPRKQILKDFIESTKVIQVQKFETQTVLADKQANSLPSQGRF